MVQTTYTQAYLSIIKVLTREAIVGERLRQVDRYKEAIERAERLREAGKLPQAFDWSRLESEDSGADMEELVCYAILFLDTNSYLCWSFLSETFLCCLQIGENYFNVFKAFKT